VTAVDVAGQVVRGEGDAWTVALARSDGLATSLDLAGLGQADDAALAAWLGDAAMPKAAHDAKLATHMLSGRGLALEGVVFETAIAAYLCAPDRRGFALEQVADDFLGSSAGLGEQAGQGALDLDGAVGEDSAARRADVIGRLVGVLRQDLGERHALELFQTVELPLSPLLARMEAAGIAIDQARLDGLGAELGRRAQAAEDAAYQALGGTKVNLASPKALQEVLFGQLGMPKTKRTKTGYSTNAQALAELFAKTGHPFLEHLLAHRDVTKLRQMVANLAAAVGPDGRIHTTFSQVAAATGRLSSAEPNLQNIPVRTEAGKQVRDAFVVGPGYSELMTADYSQIEMRIMAHLSGDQGLIEAFNSGEDLHATVASQVFGVAPADVSGAQRARIKAMSYGLAYGLSAFGLSGQLGITPGEAQKLMDQYFDRFGGVRDFLAAVVAKATQDGYTETIMGRRRYLPDLGSADRQRRDMAERAALNAPIQGSAADIVKVAMLRSDQALRDQDLKSRILLQVHDELVVEVAPGESEAVEALLREQMGGAAQLSVPLEVSVGRGSSWREAAH
jgi:DNA polymerase-1